MPCSSSLLFHRARRPFAPASRPTLSNSSANSLRTAVVGVSGYSGGELARLLLRHPRLQNTPPMFLGRMASADSSADSGSVALTSIHAQLSGLPHADDLSVRPWDWKQLQREGTD